jgi:hypothetical protein
LFRAAGGRGTGSNGASNGTNGGGYTGVANKGDGGQANSGAGQSGVVILRYPNDYTLSDSGLTHSTSTDGDFKVTTITAGTGTISFSS